MNMLSIELFRMITSLASKDIVALIGKSEEFYATDNSIK